MLDVIQFPSHLTHYRFVRAPLRFVSSHSVELSAGMNLALCLRFGD